MSARGPRELTIDLGVFLLPLILVKGTAIMMSEPPQGAAASPVTVAGPADVSSLEDYTPEWTEQQLAAADYLEALRGQPYGPSPLLHIVKHQPIPTPAGTGNGNENGTPVAVPPPDETVQMILVSRNGNVALINHRRYRVGDRLGSNGWVVKSIDAATRSVLVELPGTGREATLFVPLPRL